jgi:phosphatidylglycerol:prolipoprotein diacylglycerol transferase
VAKRSKRIPPPTAASLALQRQLARYTTLWLAVFTVILGYFTLRYVVWKMPVVSPLFLGPLKLTPFGPLVSLGILFGVHLTRQWCERFALDWLTLRDGLLWIVAVGFIVAHVGSIWMYTPEAFFEVKKYLDLRTDLSSFAGFVGGLGATIFYCKTRRLPVRPYVDGLLYGLIGGWLFGRLGCFSVHDHPGTLTQWPTGVLIRGALRHDLGFYELVFTIGLFAYLTWAMHKRQIFSGFVVAVSASSYAVVRFGLDFLRLNETTYGGLTPAQWACLPLLLLGIQTFRSRRRST